MGILLLQWCNNRGPVVGFGYKQVSKLKSVMQSGSSVSISARPVAELPSQGDNNNDI